MIDFNNIDFYNSHRLLVYGPCGSGKTLFCCNLVQCAMIQSSQFVYNVYAEVDDLNSNGFKFSKNFEHLVFSTFEVNSVGTGIPNLRTYKFNPYYFGFSGKFKTIPYPPHSIFCIDELQNYYPSNMNDYIRPEVLRKWQTSRHDGLTIIGNVQRPQDIAKKIRDIFDYYIQCYDYQEIIKDNVCCGHIWTLRIIDNNLALEEYLRTNNKDLCTEIKFRVNRCLYYNYDSYSCKHLHYKGFENSDFEIEHFNSINNDVLTTPDGYYISPKDLVVKDNNDDELVVF